MKLRWGFTLIEMMVVVLMLTILVSIGLPRLYRFIAKSRQAEAKTNLATIHTLQEAYLLENNEYFNPGSWNAGPMAGGKKYGRITGKWSNCTGSYHENKLGFRLPNCTEVRYGYLINATVGDFSAVAQGHSDTDRWIYPRCIGDPGSKQYATCSSPATSSPAVTAAWIGHDKGDGWCIDPSKKAQNYLKIIEICAGQ